MPYHEDEVPATSTSAIAAEKGLSITEEEIDEMAGDGCCGGGVGSVPYPLCIDCPRQATADHSRDRR